MTLKVSEKMHDELAYAAVFYNNTAGKIGYARPRTEDALLRRGLITYEITVANCPVITVKGWEYLASQGVTRPADPGRLTLEEALEEAYPDSVKPVLPAGEPRKPYPVTPGVTPEMVEALTVLRKVYMYPREQAAWDVLEDAGVFDFINPKEK